MEDGITVVSLFDGKSCARIALERAGIKVGRYYGSEVDKYAIQVSKKNYPDIIQLGDVRHINFTNTGIELKNGDSWLEVSGSTGPVDLFCGGSPCQSFSFAGKRKGMTTSCEIDIVSLEQYLELKQQNFQFEGQSYLFWEYVRLFKQCKPKYFFLENVMMEERWKKLITKTLGVNPIMINSELVSAQNRERLYWTNIGLRPAGLFGDPESIIPQPKDRNIFLIDILEPEVDAKYFLSDKIIEGFKKHAARNKAEGNGFAWNLKEPHEKCSSIPTGSTKSTFTFVNVVGLREVRSDEAKAERRQNRQLGIDHNAFMSKVVEARTDGKTGAILTSQTLDNAVVVRSGTLRTHKEDFGFREIKSKKAATVPARAREDGSGQNIVSIQDKIRRLTPKECERCQTVPDDYTAGVSDTQRYKMIGNGWTIEAIVHFFKYLKEELCQIS